MRKWKNWISPVIALSLIALWIGTVVICCGQEVPAPPPKAPPVAATEAYFRSQEAAAVDAVIEGRAEAQPGMTIVLSGAKTTNAAKTRWIWDKDYGFDVFECDTTKTVAFSTIRAGKYRFWLVAVGADGTLDVATHAVTVGLAAPPQPPAPTDPTPTPAPEPPADTDAALQEIRQASAAWAVKLNDKPTATMLAAEWKAASGKLRGSPDIQSAGKAAGDVFEAVMAKRTGLSRYADWLEVYRRPLNAALDKNVQSGAIKSPADLDRFIQAAAAGLTGG